MKKPLEPEFIRGPRPHRVIWWCVAVAALLAMAAWLAAWSSNTEVKKLHSTLAGINAPAAAPSAAVEPEHDPLYADSAREMLAELQPEWALTLRALESVAMIGVTPVSIEVGTKDRSARVEVELSDYAMLLQYLEALNSGYAPPQWALISAQVGQGSGAPIVAMLQRRW